MVEIVVVTVVALEIAVEAARLEALECRAARLGSGLRQIEQKQTERQRVV